VQQDVPRVIAQMPSGTVREDEDIIARLRAVPVLVHQTITLLERGLAAGITPPQITLRDVPEQAQNLVVTEPLTSPMLAAFVALPGRDRECRSAAPAGGRGGRLPRFCCAGVSTAERVPA